MISTPSQEEAKRQRELDANNALVRQYEADPAIKELADEIHHSRMMSGPACPQCIEIAIHQLHQKPE